MASEKKYLYKSDRHWYPNTSHWSRLFCCADLFVRSIKWLIRAFAWTNSSVLLRMDASSILRVASPVLCVRLFLAFINPSQLSTILCALVVRLAFILWPRAVRPNNVNYCCFEQPPPSSSVFWSTRIKLDHIGGFQKLKQPLYESQIGIVASTNYSVCCNK